jgi:hypothetical protein
MLSKKELFHVFSCFPKKELPPTIKREYVGDLSTNGRARYRYFVPLLPFGDHPLLRERKLILIAEFGCIDPKTLATSSNAGFTLEMHLGGTVRAFLRDDVY